MRLLIALAGVLLIGACGILSPATELQVENETGAMLEVLVAPCNMTLALFALLDVGARHIEEVEPGCYDLEGWTNDGRAGVIKITVAEGTLHRVPFKPE